MKYIWKDLYLAGIMGILVPGLLLNVGVMAYGEEPQPQIVTEAVTIAPEKSVPIRFQSDSGWAVKDLEEYLVGVVLAEMPASFEEEALKAQAVVARTYGVRALEGKSKHPEGDICGNAACCQGYLDPVDYGGTEEQLQKVRNAVHATSGEVLTYDRELIEATYFSCSGGATEDAVAVWGTDVPYLQSVESPGKENATYYVDGVEFTLEEFLSCLDLDLEGTPASWLGEVTYTAGGGVDTMVIGGKYFTGLELRQKLNLRSTAFEVQAEADGMTFTTKGYGHRVGMSQYGADAMAVLGRGYEEILSHYYQGTELILLEEEK